MRIQVEEVTVKKAQEWLKRNTKNRPTRQRVVDRYAESMRRGEWVANGESIKFNAAGDLVDGQHRLYAVIQSGVSIKSAVARELPENSFDTIDLGTPRNLGDYYNINGEKNAVRLAGAVKVLAFLLDESAKTAHNLHRAGLSPKQGVAFVGQYPKLRESVSFISGCCKIIAPSPAAALHYLFSEKDQDTADLFFESLGSGTSLKKSDPVYRLRELLLAARRKNSRSSIKVVPLMAMTIKAWNLTRAGKPCAMLRWLPKEEFPEIA